jgi:UDP-N-acetylmuramate--alanine ligase
MPGAHNVLNCLAAIAVADELAVPRDVTKEALATFDGVGRRFSVVGEVAGVKLVDDYGHHPAEIRATLDAARRAFPEVRHRIVAVFQPHRYSRTQDLFDDFALSFNQTDLLFVTGIYPAGEQPIEGVSAETLVKAIEEHGHQGVELAEDKDDLPQRLSAVLREGDVVITLGAGDINRIHGELAELLASHTAEPSSVGTAEEGSG